MNVEKVVSIYRNCGFKINNICGYHFLDRGWINYSFPQLVSIPVTSSLINSLIWKYLITVVKTESKIKNTYEFVLETNDYSIDRFAHKKRSDIRKSLRDCKFKRPSLEELFQFGLRMNQQTLTRQGRRDKMLTNPVHWKKYITSFYSEENIYILGAYIQDRMVGYITVCKIIGAFYIIDPYYDKLASASSPIHGLIFTLVNQLIEKNGSIRISYGIDSFNPLPNLSKYKQSLQFKRVPATRVYIINPILMPFLRLVVFFYIRVLKRKRIKSSWVQKIVRLIQGNRIILKTNKNVRSKLFT